MEKVRAAVCADTERKRIDGAELGVGGSLCSRFKIKCSLLFVVVVQFFPSLVVDSLPFYPLLSSSLLVFSFLFVFFFCKAS